MAARTLDFMPALHLLCAQGFHHRCEAIVAACPRAVEGPCDAGEYTDCPCRQCTAAYDLMTADHEEQHHLVSYMMGMGWTFDHAMGFLCTYDERHPEEVVHAQG